MPRSSRTFPAGTLKGIKGRSYPAIVGPAPFMPVFLWVRGEPKCAPRALLITVVMLASLVVSAGGGSKPPENVPSTIQYLLEYVADSGLTFIRNSENHTAADAAKHMNDKYQYFRDKIQTPEDFIRRCASKSLITGKPYLVIMENGDEVRNDDWLLQALKSYRHRYAENLS